ncbi:MAG: hypothetical protein K2P15_01855 [Oscillospiraceae bacterium]|jgi:hypothetical protein|nr:hypothetical protein [Oscillospiraceae bacterium]MDE6899796.1 hypothetical protein [Oscillospiraceae bacterium]
MKRRMYRARRRMNHVISELSHALLLAGGREIDLRLVREDDGLRLHLEGDFTPEHQRSMEHMAKLLQPLVRDPALVETYGELPGEDQYSEESELSLVGQMVDRSAVTVEPGRVRMDLFLAY